ncbi:MAG: hypothetical protein HUJ73_01595, partial [Eubacterium sp.]|nr:hypothetical protein [Eubacterium sp.]
MQNKFENENMQSSFGTAGHFSGDVLTKMMTYEEVRPHLYTRLYKGAGKKNIQKNPVRYEWMDLSIGCYCCVPSEGEERWAVSVTDEVLS